MNKLYSCYKICILMLAVLLLFSVSNPAFCAPEEEVWIKNLDMASDDLHEVVYGADKFVAVGGDGVILFSYDGLKWVRVPSGTRETLQCISWNGKEFAAAGIRGTVLRSEDGITWTGSRLGEDCFFCDMFWDGSRFVAVGTSYKSGVLEGRPAQIAKGILATSPDGKDWSLNYLTDIESIRTIAYNQKKYVISGSKRAEENMPGDNGVFYSENLSGWKDATGIENINLFSMLWDGRNFIGVGFDGRITTSLDGELWSETRLTPGYGLVSIAYDGNRYVAAGTGVIQISGDGVHWSKVLEVEEAGRGNFDGIVWSGERFVAVGQSGIICWSENGIDWQEAAPAKCNNFNSLLWDGEQFIAVGEKGNIFSSQDGQQWVNRSYPTFLGVKGIAKGRDLYVAVGGQQFMRSSGGMIISSRDLSGWSEGNTEKTGMNAEIDYGNEVNAVATDGKQFIAVQGSGKLLRSKDGLDWTVSKSENNVYLSDIVWDGSRFIAAGYQGTILVSGDGSRWKKYAGDKSLNFKRLIHAGGKYVATAWSQDSEKFRALILSSGDGTNWEIKKSFSRGYLNGIAFDGKQFFVTGEHGTLLKSQDLTEWTEEATGTDNTLTAAAWDGKKLIVVGAYGTVLYKGHAVSIPMPEPQSAAVFGKIAEQEAGKVENELPQLDYTAEKRILLKNDRPNQSHVLLLTAAALAVLAVIFIKGRKKSP